MRGFRKNGIVGVGMTLAFAVVLTSCQSGQGGTDELSGERTGSGVSSLMVAEPEAAISVSPAGDSAGVRLDKPVKVQVRDGLLTDVAVTGRDGVRLDGRFNASKTTWTADSRLSPSSTYSVRASAINAEGVKSSTSQSFRTLTPETILGTDITPADKQTVGIGMPLVVKFDEPIKDKAGVERRLSVETSKPVEGAWHWFTDTEVHYRPKAYWPTDTDVTLRTNLRGVSSGSGAWGIKDKVKRFHIGRSVITKVDLFDHRARVYLDGKSTAARSIPVTGGKPGWETRNGTKVVMAKEMWKRFTNELINAPEDYDLMSKYAIRVTNSGEFLHTASWSTGSQGSSNVSHGCVGMNTSNSGWLYGMVKMGDPVEVKSNGADLPAYGNGFGDWNMSWEKWKAGSALNP